MHPAEARTGFEPVTSSVRVDQNPAVLSATTAGDVLGLTQTPIYLHGHTIPKHATFPFIFQMRAHAIWFTGH